ncbi:hypothetical protein ACWCY6_23525 [Streptomyces sp. 900105755]
MSDRGSRYARRAGDVIAAMTLVAFEVVALFGVLGMSLLPALGGVSVDWVLPACLGGLALCAGILAAATWTVRMWVTSAVQGLVSGCCLVTLLTILIGGPA